MTSNDRKFNVKETDTNNSQIFFFTKVAVDETDGSLSLEVYDKFGELMSCNDEILDRLDTSHASQEVTMFVMSCLYNGEKCSLPKIYATNGSEIATSPISVEVPMGDSTRSEYGIEPITVMEWNAVQCTVAKTLQFTVELTTAKGETLRNDPVADVERDGPPNSSQN